MRRLLSAACLSLALLSPALLPQALAMPPTALPARAPQSGEWVALNGHRFAVELALDDASRAQGLMYRRSMPTAQGMLFVHDREEPLAYWMRNTLIALDILYFDRTLRLVSVQREVPPCPPGARCPVYPSDGDAMYVLELNAGQAARIGVARGDSLELGPSLQHLRAR